VSEIDFGVEYKRPQGFSEDGGIVVDGAARIGRIAAWANDFGIAI